MTARVRGITIDVADLERAAVFWSSLLGVDIEDRHDTYLWLGEISPGVRLILQQVPDSKRSKNRVHLDIQAEGETDLVAVVEALGGSRVGDVDDLHYSLTVVADPDGDEFCVIHRLSPALGGIREMP